MTSKSSPIKANLRDNPRRSLRRLSHGTPTLSRNSQRLSAVSSSLLKHSILTDNSDVDIVDKSKWWEVLGDQSQNVMEVLEINNYESKNVTSEITKANDPKKFLNDLGVEVLSQSHRDYPLDLPESSDNETVQSIIIPEKRLFNQKENKTKPMFSQLIGARETLASNLPRKSQAFDKASARQKQLFGLEPAKKTGTKMTALLNISNKSNDKTKRRFFDETIVSKTKPTFPSALLDMTHNKTAPNKTIETKVKTLFSQKTVVKRNNIYAQFIASESEEELSEVESKPFAVPKLSIVRRPSSLASRGRESSPASVTTDLEVDDWRMLPSSTMMEEQLKLASVTPVKKMKFSKISEMHDETLTQQSNTKSKIHSVSKAPNENSVSEMAKSSKRNVSKSVHEDTIIDVPAKNSSNTTSNKSKTANASNTLNNKPVTQMTDVSKIEDNINADNVITEKDDENSNQNEIINKSLKDSINTNDITSKKAIIKSTSNIAKSIDKTLNQTAYENEILLNKSSSKSSDKDNQSLTHESIDKMVLRFEDDIEGQENTENKPTATDNSLLIAQLTGKDINKEINNKSSKNLTTNDKQIENKIVDETADEIYKEVLKLIGNEDTNSELVESVLGNDKSNDAVNENQSDTLNQKQENDREKVLNEVQHNQKKRNSEPKENIDSDNKIKEPSFEQDLENQGQLIESEEEIIESEEEIIESEQEPEESEEELNYDESEEEKEQSEVIDDDREPSINNVTENRSAVDIEDENKQPEGIEDDNQQSEDIEVVKEQSQVIDDEKEPSLDYADNEESSQDIENEKIQRKDIEDEKEQTKDIEINNKQPQVVDDDTTPPLDVEYTKESSLDNEKEKEQPKDIEDKKEQSRDVKDQEGEDPKDNQDSNGSHQIENEDVINKSDEQLKSKIDNLDTENDLNHKPDKNIHEDYNDDQEVFVDQDKSHKIRDIKEASKYFEEIPETTVVSQNVSHDTTGRNRQKDKASIIDSPEIVRSEKQGRTSSFSAKGRNTSIRKTILNKKPETQMDSITSSIGLSDGTKNSSAEGSGWDSHRTTRKTLRQTFGRDFTPRKSLRTLVMEKSAKKQTLTNQLNEKQDDVPSDYETEVSMPQEVDVEDLVESDHEASMINKQHALDMFTAKMKEDIAKRKRKVDNKMKDFEELLKKPRLNTIPKYWAPVKPFAKSSSQPAKHQAKQKKLAVPVAHLPKGFLDDLNYKPPKRFAPKTASWITNRLYKFLESKLEPKYDFNARVRAEKFVQKLYDFVKIVRRHDVAPEYLVDELKYEMARLNIVHTHFEFYEFFEDYLPMEIVLSVVPDLKNKISMPRGGVYTEILRRD